MKSANEIQVGGTHYNESQIQHWDMAVSYALPYLEGQVTKYVTRWRKKNGLQDLEKAAHFAQKLYEVEEHRQTYMRDGGITGTLYSVVVWLCGMCERLYLRMASNHRTNLYDYGRANGLGQVEMEAIWAIVTANGELNKIAHAKECIEILIQAAKLGCAPEETDAWIMLASL